MNIIVSSYQVPYFCDHFCSYTFFSCYYKLMLGTLFDSCSILQAREPMLFVVIN